MNQLELAIKVALEAHEAQTDRQGLPYILHPLTVMQHVEGEEARITAVLHDVIEDSSLELSDLVDLGFSDGVLTAVDLMTHRENVSYDDYVRALKENETARQVKLADLAHNMDMRRMNSPLTQKDLDRLAKYRRAWAILTDE
jgi:(p)ppGpp synthase/HD superfamily hydrolase